MLETVAPSMNSTALNPEAPASSFSDTGDMESSNENFDLTLNEASNNLDGVAGEESLFLQEAGGDVVVDKNVQFEVPTEEALLLAANEETLPNEEIIAQDLSVSEEVTPQVLPYLHPQPAQELLNLQGTGEGEDQNLLSAETEADPEMKMLNSLKQLMGRSNVRPQETMIPQDPRFSLSEQAANAAQASQNEGFAAVQAQAEAQANSGLNSTESKTDLPNQTLQSVLSAAQPLATPDVRTQSERIQSVLNQTIQGKQNKVSPSATASDRIDLSQILNPEQTQGITSAVPAGLVANLANNDGLSAPEIKKVSLDSSSSLMQVNSNDTQNTGLPLQSNISQQVDSSAFIDSLKTAQVAQQDPLLDAPFDMEQISKHMNLSKVKAGDDNEITLQLTPENLGKLTMRIHQKGQDLSVEMRVDSQQTKQILEANFAELKQRFLDKDFSFENLNVSVNVDQGSNSQFGQAPNQSRFQGDYVADQQSERIAGLESEASKQRPNLSSSGVHMYV